MDGTSGANRCPDRRPPVPHRDLIHNDGPPSHSGGHNTPLCSSVSLCGFMQSPAPAWRYLHLQEQEQLTPVWTPLKDYPPTTLTWQNGSKHSHRYLAPKADSTSTYMANYTNSVCVQCWSVRPTPEDVPSLIVRRPNLMP